MDTEVGKVYTEDDIDDEYAKLYDELNDKARKVIEALGDELHISVCLHDDKRETVTDFDEVICKGRARFVNQSFQRGPRFLSKIYDNPTYWDAIEQANKMYMMRNDIDHRYLESVDYLKTTVAGIHHLTFFMGS